MKLNRTQRQAAIRTLPENGRIAQATLCVKGNYLITNNGKDIMVFTFHIIFHNHA